MGLAPGSMILINGQGPERRGRARRRPTSLSPVARRRERELRCALGEAEPAGASRFRQRSPGECADSLGTAGTELGADESQHRRRAERRGARCTTYR